MDKDTLLKHGMILVASVALFIFLISKIDWKYDETIESNSNSIKIVHCYYNGHDYIEFINEYHNREGISHNPDCEKCKENIKSFVIKILNDSIK